MIPILYDRDETEFSSNGLGRLRDCISCTVTEERNGIYECDFEYPVDGLNYGLIEEGRIIACTHDTTGDVQPFDIVSHTKPIEGVVSFHAVHISYRQSKITVSGENINSLGDAFSALSGGQPENPFSYIADRPDAAGYVAAFDGIPRSVRQILGGVEGSILDTFRGEYKFDKFNVYLSQNRGVERDVTIRYGVNMAEYEDNTDYSETYNAVIPYWTGNNNGQDVIVKGGIVSSGATSYTGRTECVPLDLSDKFEEMPSATELENMALSMIASEQTNLPSQTISVGIVQLQEQPELQKCVLCDTIKVVFPRYNMSGWFKIVKTEYNVLLGRFSAMELGTLSVSLADALGIGSDGTFSSNSLPAQEPVPYVYSASNSTAQTISGTSAKYVYFEPPSGVRIIGVVGFSSSRGMINVFSATVETSGDHQGEASFGLYNPTSSSVSNVTLNVRLLVVEE